MADTTSSSSAAVRVFDIPELLEHILVHLAESSTPLSFTFDFKPIKDIRPLSTLCAVRRVNRMFNDVAATSTKLQRLIRKPLLNGKDAFVDLRLPGGMELLFCFDKSEAAENPYHMVLTKLDVSAADSAEKGLDACPQASWRRVRICAQNGQPLNFLSRPSVARQIHRRYWMKKFENDTTLGEVFDNLKEDVHEIASRNSAGDRIA